MQQRVYPVPVITRSIVWMYCNCLIIAFMWFYITYNRRKVIIHILQVRISWQKNLAAPCKEFKLWIWSIATINRRLHVAFNSIFLKAVIKWHYIYISLVITKDAQIRKWFIHYHYNIGVFLPGFSIPAVILFCFISR